MPKKREGHGGFMQKIATYEVRAVVLNCKNSGAVSMGKQNVKFPVCPQGLGTKSLRRHIPIDCQQVRRKLNV